MAKSIAGSFLSGKGRSILPLPPDHFALSQEVRNLGLLFSIFKDGWTDNGFIVLGIESVDFPDVQIYTFNNPEII